MTRSNFFTQSSYNKLQDLECSISEVTERIDDIEMKQILKEDLIKRMTDQIQECFIEQLNKFENHKSYDFSEDIEQLRKRLYTTNLFDFNYKKDFLEWPSE